MTLLEPEMLMMAVQSGNSYILYKSVSQRLLYTGWAYLYWIG